MSSDDTELSQIGRKRVRSNYAEPWRGGRSHKGAVEQIRPKLLHGPTSSSVAQIFKSPEAAHRKPGTPSSAPGFSAV
jgi:hypothetical protein